MKIKDGFVLRKFMGECIVLPTGDCADQKNAIITLSKTGEFVWNLMLEEIDYESILHRILDEYDVEEAVARADLDAFLMKARKEGLILEQS